MQNMFCQFQTPSTFILTALRKKQNLFTSILLESCTKTPWNQNSLVPFNLSLTDDTQHWENLLAWDVNDILHNLTFIKTQCYLLNLSPACQRQTCQWGQPIVTRLTHFCIVLQGFVYPSGSTPTQAIKQEDCRTAFPFGWFNLALVTEEWFHCLRLSHVHETLPGKKPWCCMLIRLETLNISMLDEV